MTDMRGTEMDDYGFMVCTDFESWLKLGRDMGYIDDTFCWVHGEPKLTDEEQSMVDSADGDLDIICVTVARVGD